MSFNIKSLENRMLKPDNAQVDVKLDLAQERIDGVEFIAEIIHELFGSLQVISSSLEILQLNNQSERNTKYLDRAMKGMNHATLHVADLRNFLKFNKDVFSIHPCQFDPSQIVTEVYSDFQDAALSNDQTLSLTLPDETRTITSDPSRFKQILTNLVSNAIRYGGKGEICILMKYETDSLKVSVQDFGEGIPKDKQKKIFEPFSQLSPERQIGSGLGLAIVSKLTALLGGSIVLKSEVGSGSLFEVTIPTQLLIH